MGKWQGGNSKAKKVKAKFQSKNEPYQPDYKRTCSNCGGRGHDADTCSSKMMCSVCGVPGHTKNECWNITKKCEICGKKGHLKNVCTMKTTQKLGPGWWKPTGKDSDGRGCVRCGASKFHPKHLCKSFKHLCEICGQRNHFENMCGAKPPKKARQEWRANEDWKDANMNEEWNENSEMKANEDEEKYAMNEDWKARDRDAEQNEWKEMGTQLSKGEWMSKTDSQKPDCTSSDWEKWPEKPWPATPPKTKRKVKHQQNKECYCCGSWQHEKIFCPFAHRRCELCGRKGHLKQKCDPSIARSKFEDFEAKVPYIPGPEVGEPEEMDQMDKEDKMEKEDNSCTCCGSLEHETEQCALIDLTCELCGMPGHIEKMCLIQVPKTESVPEPLDPPKVAVPEPLIPPKAEVSEACLCCGEFGHQKASCPQANCHCTWCGQQGHLRKMCTSAPKQDLRPT